MSTPGDQSIDVRVSDDRHREQMEVENIVDKDTDHTGDQGEDEDDENLLETGDEEDDDAVEDEAGEEEENPAEDDDEDDPDANDTEDLQHADGDDNDTKIYDTDELDGHPGSGIAPLNVSEAARQNSAGNSDNRPLSSFRSRTLLSTRLSKKPQEDSSGVYISPILVAQRCLPSRVLASGTTDDIAEKVLEITHLRLDRESIRSMENVELFSFATHLYLQHNNIEQIENLDYLPNLYFLAIFNNKLTCIDGIEEATVLRFLDISNNQISTMNFDLLPKSLEYLFVAGNPFTDTTLDYKEKIIRTLPHLKELDGLIIRTAYRQELGQVPEDYEGFSSEGTANDDDDDDDDDNDDDNDDDDDDEDDDDENIDIDDPDNEDSNIGRDVSMSGTGTRLGRFRGGDVLTASEQAEMEEESDSEHESTNIRKFNTDSKLRVNFEAEGNPHFSDQVLGGNGNIESDSNDLVGEFKRKLNIRKSLLSGLDLGDENSGPSSSMHSDRAGSTHSSRPFSSGGRLSSARVRNEHLTSLVSDEGSSELISDSDSVSAHFKSLRERLHDIFESSDLEGSDALEVLANRGASEVAATVGSLNHMLAQVQTRFDKKMQHYADETIHIRDRMHRHMARLVDEHKRENEALINELRKKRLQLMSSGPSWANDTNEHAPADQDNTPDDASM